ncbi:MAG: iron chaperone [Candidatus Thorarchaeota archaeon]
MDTKRKRSETIDEYIVAFPPGIRKKLKDLRNVIQESAPTAKETISYGMPTFKLKRNLVHFAAHKEHIGFYPGGPSAIDAFKEELKEYTTSKGAIRFPLDLPIPIELVRKIVKFRVAEEEQKYKD